MGVQELITLSKKILSNMDSIFYDVLGDNTLTEEKLTSLLKHERASLNIVIGCLHNHLEHSRI